MLRSGLARLVRGYFRVFTLPKVAFVIGMALMALNMKTVEQEWLAEHAEVTELDDTTPDADLGDNGMYASPSSGDAAEVAEVATPPPEP